MRLWSLHPKYLDRQGLLACWREGLLAQKTLFELVVGRKYAYQNHPQLDRFKPKDYDRSHLVNDTMGDIGGYLYFIWEEAKKRGYNFDINNIEMFNIPAVKNFTVTKGQLNYEWKHLENKLDNRHSQTQFDKNCQYSNYGKNIEPHPLFKVIEGDIESWEKQK